MGTEGHPTSGLIDAFCEGYRIGDDLYIAGQEKLGAIDLNTKEFRYCREEKSWAEDITQGVKITTAEGIGFAIPINNVKPIIKKLEEKGEVNSATLGVYAYDKDIVPYINEQLGTKMSLENGIYIAEIIRNSPADKAKLKKGDIILEIDGIKLNKMSTLRNYIYEKEVGDKVTIRYVHNKKENEIEVTLSKK